MRQAFIAFSVFVLVACMGAGKSLVLLLTAGASSSFNTGSAVGAVYLS